jgi:enolase-phosphatase E1
VSGAARIRVVLLDIEGTTTPIAFVHDTLFPHARAHLDQYLSAHARSPEVSDAVARLAAEYPLDKDEPGAPAWSPDSPASAAHAAAYARWLMDRDRKSPGLKLLQGLIWRDGYRDGQLHGQVYDDVPKALEAWRARGIDVAIYSSGSELAQRLLFGSTPFGDLTSSIRAFFDTSVGAKSEPASYRNIASRLGCTCAEIVFVSDVTRELAAAAAAGCATRLSIRSGNPPQPDAARYDTIASLLDLRT